MRQSTPSHCDADMDLEITFPASSSEDAGLFAGEFRTMLLSHGISKELVRPVRTNAANMDVGSALEIARLGMEAILAAHAAFSFGQIISEFAKRNNCLVRIRSQAAHVDVTTSVADHEMFVTTLKKLAELYGAASDK